MKTDDARAQARVTALPSGLLVVLRNVSHGANDLYWFVLPPALPLILKEFGLRYTAAGGMIAAFLCMTAVASMFMGRLSDRVHRTRLIGFGFLLASATLWLGAAMPILPLVIGCLVVGGIGVATYHPAAYAAIHDAGGSKGRTYGVFESSGSLAIVLMLAVQGLLVSRIGWRGTLAVGAVPGMLVGLFLLTVPGASVGGPVLEPASRRAQAAPVASAGRADLLLPALFVVGVMLRALGVTAIQNFIPTYLVREVHMEQSLASFAMGFAFLGAMAGSYTMGRLADRIGPFPVFLAGSGALVPLLGLMSLRLPAWAYPLLLVLFGFASSSCLPPQNMILTSLSGSRGKGQVFGLLMGMTTLTASASPLLFGMLADGAGLVTAVRLCAIPPVAGWLVVLLVRGKLGPTSSRRGSAR
jgi:MFS transporter, FSR family, fosmidomycin resistance protein